jgi:hypothetical protein
MAESRTQYDWEDRLCTVVKLLVSDKEKPQPFYPYEFRSEQAGIFVRLGMYREVIQDDTFLIQHCPKPENTAPSEQQLPPRLQKNWRRALQQAQQKICRDINQNRKAPSHMSDRETLLRLFP